MLVVLGRGGIPLLLFLFFLLAGRLQWLDLMFFLVKFRQGMQLRLIHLHFMT